MSYRPPAGSPDEGVQPAVALGRISRRAVAFALTTTSLAATLMLAGCGSPAQSPTSAPVLFPSPTTAPTATAQPTATPPPTATPVPSATPTPAPIFPVAVIIENHPDARPQSGLARADMLYEAPVEGAISRFMAVYVNGKSDTIGPVRSARHYFVYLAAEYNAVMVHIGASPQGFGALVATELVNLDETYSEPGFWRSRARYAPHNAYTSTDLVQDALKRTRDNVTPGGLAGFKFRDDSKPVEGKEAPEVSIQYPRGDSVRYVYSEQDRTYRRFLNGAPHRDAETGEQIAPRNLVVQVTRMWPIPGDTAGRLDMEQVGEGKALFFRDGVVTEGIWKKASYGDVTEWYDAAGQRLLFNPGKIFVQIVQPEAGVRYQARSSLLLDSFTVSSRPGAIIQAT